MSNGNYSDGRYAYTFTLPNEEADVVVMSYNYDDDAVYITSFIYSSDGTASNGVTLNVESGDFLSIYDGSVYCSVMGYVDPATYTEKTQPSFYQYEGLSYLEDSMEELAKSGLKATVAVYGYFLDEYVGLDLDDMGFYSFG